MGGLPDARMHTRSWACSARRTAAAPRQSLGNPDFARCRRAARAARAARLVGLIGLIGKIAIIIKKNQGIYMFLQIFIELF